MSAASRTRPPELAAALVDLLEGGPLMDGQVVGLVALDDVLRLRFRGVPPVALKDDLPGHFLLDRPPDPACFRVPLDMIARLEVGRHPMPSFYPRSHRTSNTTRLKARLSSRHVTSGK